MTFPKYLYHYTTVETLALIIKNKNIKFNPLTVMDDKQEEQNANNSFFGRYVFISSWTDDENESIPMWNMYSDMKTGVRIRLRSFPFVNYDVLGQISKEGMIIPLAAILGKEYQLINYVQNHTLFQVEYTDEKNLLEPEVETVDQIKNKINIDLGRMGKHKKKIWEFQKEWRYILMFAPYSVTEMMMHGKELGNFTHDKFKDKNNFPPFESYFLQIAEEAFNEMEITLSPKISEGNRIIVNHLKDIYNSNVTVKESSLKNDLR